MRNKQFFTPLLILTLTLVTLLPWGTAQAATITVNTANDELDGGAGNGVCSLREAISNANNNNNAQADCAAGTAALDTITFDAATDENPIILAGAAGEDANASGDLDILDGGDLIIQGNGAANTIIDGGWIDRVFHICPAGGCASTVTLTGVTIRNGPGGNAGGGIFNNTTLTVDGSTISANTADYGGGIFNNAPLTVTNSIIGGVGAGNTATEDGGGIHASSTVTLDGSTISANTAANGGGIFNHDQARLKVANSTIRANTATEDGGGIYNGIDGTTTVDGSTISANTATTNGGGIYNGSGGTTTVDASAVISNTATVSGGGIYNYTGTALVVSSTISANTAYFAGGIYNHSALTITNSTVISNTAAYSGGGISNDVGTTMVDGTTIISNTALIGGGIYNRATLKVQNGSTVKLNSADIAGGGISNLDGSTYVDASIISSNSATNFGGGIFNGATLTVTNSTIGGFGLGNSATNRGGGIYTQGGTTRVTSSRILYNTASMGGGVYINMNIPWSTTVIGSCIVGNSSPSFFNEWDAEQIASGNWWGAATGPNTIGGDSVDGNVYFLGFLTEPILGCAPDLQVDKANDTGGNGTVGTPFNWTLTVANTGVMDAIFYAGQRILDDDLPAGSTYGTPVAGNFVDITNGANIACSITSNTLTCEATGANVTIGAATGSFDVVLSVTPNASGDLTNPAGNCRVDPDENVGEADEGNNNCPADSVDITTRTVYLYLPLVMR